MLRCLQRPLCARCRRRLATRGEPDNRPASARTTPPPNGVQGSRHVDVEVGVDPTDDGAVSFYDGHGHPFFLFSARGGTAVPGRSAGDLRPASTGRRSPLRNGACRFMFRDPVDKASKDSRWRHPAPKSGQTPVHSKVSRSKPSAVDLAQRAISSVIGNVPTIWPDTPAGHPDGIDAPRACQASLGRGR